VKLATIAVIAFFVVVALASVIAMAVLEEADADDDGWIDDALADLLTEEQA
jgi:hypothetical protein